LFDMQADPRETRDLAGDPGHGEILAEHEQALRAICDPDEIDRRAKADQRRLIDAAGGEAAIMQAVIPTYFPPPVA
jgi:choline-sulfatase